MLPDPYAPPKAEVRDPPPGPKAYWIRTGWYYLLVFGGLLCVTFLFFEKTLTQSLNGLTLAASAGLTALLCIWPLQALVARRTCSVPWWWNALFFPVVSLVLVGAVMDDADLIAVGLLPFVGLCAMFAIASLWVEARYDVRVYSTANGVAFVKRDDWR